MNEDKQEKWLKVKTKTKRFFDGSYPFLMGVGTALALTSIVKLKKDQLIMVQNFVNIIHNEQALSEVQKATEHLIRKES